MSVQTFKDVIWPIRDKLYRFALRITGNAHEAEDVVQEVLERVWVQSEVQTGAVQNWEAWCMTMTRNRSLDKTRMLAQRRTAPLEGASDQHAHGADPAKSAEDRDLAARVRHFMQDLPEKQRLVMHLRDIEELSYEEITQVLDIPLDQVKVNLHRARKNIRERLLQVDSVTAVNV